jgi:hypothetical protein
MKDNPRPKYEIRSFQDLANVINEKNVDMLCGNLYGALRQFIEMRKKVPEIKFMGIDWIDDGKIEIRNPDVTLIIQEPESKPKMSDKKLSYNPKPEAKKKKKTPSIEDRVNSFQTKNKEGFTGFEIRVFMKLNYPRITMKEFNEKMGHVTCKMKDGETVFYPCDIITTIRCCLEKRDQNALEFD